MTINTFSTILSIGTIILLSFSLLVTFENKFTFMKDFINFKIKVINKFLSIFNFKNKSKNISHDTFYILAIAVVTGLSIVGAEIYERIYMTPPCVLCWWGRIALFPIFPIALVALNYKVTNINKIIMLLAFFGLVIATYHYYYHFNIYVLDNALSMPCDANPLLPSCSNNNGILVWSFITMPLMGFMNFLSIMLLANKIRE